MQSGKSSLLTIWNLAKRKLLGLKLSRKGDGRVIPLRRVRRNGSELGRRSLRNKLQTPPAALHHKSIASPTTVKTHLRRMADQNIPGSGRLELKSRFETPSACSISTASHPSLAPKERMKK